MDDTVIRDAEASDAAGIAAIYNDAVIHTTAIWNETPVDADNRRAWLAERQAGGFPVLVAEGEGHILGYATFGPWRPHEGYRHTVEHSVYVLDAARGRGLGRALMQALLARAADAGLHVMVGGIEAGNQASLALHRALGFRETARMPQVGRKFDRWLDLVFMQRFVASDAVD
ncbi:MAG: N-acetyltransferase [Rhodocyclaceae bacterium]|nr:N-acetyltransferase [Rhodocyclaceae bacterium]